MKRKKQPEIPSTEALEQELQRVKYKSRYIWTLKTTLYTLLSVAAAAVLIACLWLPVLQIYGSSMSPTLAAGDIVLAVKNADMKQGDIIAFYYNNKILVKRYIASAGDWIDIDRDGQVYVNDKPLSEPYVPEPDLGQTDIELPFQVPDGKVFVMGDHRRTSLDSRNTAVGCVSQEQLVGRIVLRLWPFDRIGNFPDYFEPIF